MVNKAAQLVAYIKANPGRVGKVVDIDYNIDKLYQLDLTAGNKELDAATVADEKKFSAWINERLTGNGCLYGIGGYMENRTIYAHSPLFNNSETPRRHHLGVDIWARAGTHVYAPLAGTVHSFKNNDNYGDYGPTIILEHDLNGLKLYTLYGHLSLKSLAGLKSGETVEMGRKIAILGEPYENGNWPPHLHLQLMFDMQGHEGDYPGVCSLDEKDWYRKNIPDPQLLLNFPKAVNG